jgi:two-component SAPR family response regulator
MSPDPHILPTNIGRHEVRGLLPGTGIAAVCEEPPERPLEGLPESAQAVAEKALRKAPDLHHQPTGELTDALEQGVPLMPDIDEDVSRVLAKDKDACALQVYAFGGGRVVRDGHKVSASEWQWAMVKEMFFYILLYGPLDRSAIGAVFWPNLTARKVKNNFHNAMTRMRKAVGANAVVMEDRLYRIEEDYWFDVEEFEALVKRAQSLSPQDWHKESLWRRAATLYQGDFLPEANRVWYVATREACQEMYLDALIGIGRCREAQEEFGEAVAWYKRVLEVEELREDVHRRIMDCYTKMGRRSDAVAQYRRCREALLKELGLEPSPETETLYKRIATGRRQKP